MQNKQKPRIASVTADAMTVGQRAAADIVAAGPRQSVRGPFAVLLNSPGVFAPAQALGTYLRFENAMPANLRELAILVTARHWRQDYEWRVHSAIALDAGLNHAAIAAIAAGDQPPGLTGQEAIVYEFCRQLHATTSVDDAVFARAERLLGPDGVIDLCAICGYYAMLAMVMNVARNPLPDGNSPFGQNPTG